MIGNSICAQEPGRTGRSDQPTGVSVEEAPIKRAISSQPVAQADASTARTPCLRSGHRRPGRSNTNFVPAPDRRPLRDPGIEHDRCRPLPIYMDYARRRRSIRGSSMRWFPGCTSIRQPGARAYAWGWDAEAVEKPRACCRPDRRRSARDRLDPGRPSRTTSRSRARRTSTRRGQPRHRQDRAQAVLDTMREMERQGFEVTYLDVQPDGWPTSTSSRAAIRPDTILAR